MHSRLLLAFLCLLAASSSFAQGIIVNEISQGPAGAQEYIELLVVGSDTQKTGTVDLRNWIIDDNSGAFMLGDNSAPGIAIGHFRFAPSDTFQAVPIGAMIVIYNVADKNPNWTFVLTDAGSNDIPHIENSGMTYYIPGTSTLLRACSGTPNNTSTSYAYTSSTIPPIAANWTGEIGLANNGDAIQTRRPDGTFFHGFGFSTPTQANAFTSFPVFPEVNLPSFNAFAGVAAAKVTYFDCGSWYYSSNFITGNATTSAATTNETPGLPNTANNDSLIAHVRNGQFNYSLLSTNVPCATILPVGLLSFTARQEADAVVLQWQTVHEYNNDHFEIERSAAQKTWTGIGKVPGAGNSNTLRTYGSRDNAPLEGLSFYRLKQADRDGAVQYSPVVSVRVTLSGDLAAVVYPNPADEQLQVNNPYPLRYTLYNTTGIKVKEGIVAPAQPFIRVDKCSAGLYMLYLNDSRGRQQQVKVIKK